MLLKLSSYNYNCYTYLKYFFQVTTVPRDSVIHFVSTVMDKYIPNKIFGFKKNLTRFIQNVKKILKFNKMQKPTLGILLDGVLKEKEMWKKTFFAKLALWIFDKFVIKLIPIFFYVSEQDKVGL